MPQTHQRGLEQLDIVINNSPALISYVGSDRRYRWCNRAYTEWFQRPTGDVVGREMREVLGEEAWATIGPRIEAAFAGETIEYEAEAKYRGAGTRWIRATYTPHRDEHGTVLGIVVMVHDITEIKESELRTRFLADLVDDLTRFTDPAAIERAIVERVGRFLGVEQCTFVQLTADRDIVPRDVLRVFERGESSVSDDVTTPGDSGDLSTWSGLPAVRAFVAAPVHSAGEVAGVLVVASAMPRAWGRDEVAFVREVAQRGWPLMERARATAALQESRARFDLVREGAQIGFWFCDLPFDTLIWDNRVKEHFWLPPSAVVTIDTFYERLHPADREFTRSAIAASIANRTLYDIEYRTVSDAGAERWIRAIGRTFYDASGQPIRFDGVTLDITDRKRMDDALRESEKRFRNMADHAPVMIWITDPDGSCTYLSRSWYEFTGQTPETALGHGWLDATHPDDQAVAAETFLAANSRQEAFRLDYRLRKVDGSYAWAIDSAAPRFGADGEFLGYVGSVLDITERKRMEDALKEGDRRKDEFLAMLAHELRNPLAPIRNATEVLRVAGEGDPSRVWARDVIERQTQHITRMVDDLLDVSRITQRKIVLRRERVDAAAILERSVEASRPLIDARRQRLMVTLTPAVTLDADQTRLVQVFANLLNNASKFTDEGGDISLVASVDHDELVVSVRDSGVGIAAELLPHVFDLFTQADRSLDRSQGGLGIGLTLVRLLVELHGGSVAAQSDGLGAGSVFTVRLPLAGQVEQGSADAPIVSTAPSRDATRRILLVEDNVDSAEMLSVMLSLHGFTTDIAHDGEEALQVAARFAPHIVCCDIGLPRMDGYEVARRLRSLLPPASFLIAISGYGQDHDRARSAEAGFDHHLTKPVEPTVLLALLDGLSIRDR